jgi:hypothetical protein
MKIFGNWTTFFLSIVAFCLPWQTRWMYGAVQIDGAHTEFGIMSIYAVEIMAIIGVLVGWLLDRTPSRMSIRPGYQAPIRFGGVVLVVVALGTAFADRSMFSFSMLTHLMVAYVFFGGLLLDRVRFQPILAAFVLGLVSPVTLGLLQVFSGISPASTFFGLAARNAAQLGDAVFTIDGARVLRAYGSFPHPNIFGGFLGVGLFAWWSIVASFRKRTWHGPVSAFGTGLLLIGLIFTGSRSAFLGVLVGLVFVMFVYAIRSMRLARPLVSIMLLMAIAGSLFASFHFSDVAAGIRGGGVNEERSLTERVALYERFVPFMLVTNPWFGHGIGSYALSYADFDPGHDVYTYQPIHNVALLMLAEIGILGVLAMIAWTGSAYRINLSRFPKKDALYAFGMASVVLIISFYDHYLWSSWVGLSLIALVLAMMVRMGEE